MQKVFRLPSQLYFDLFSTPELSGDKLIAVYSILKTSRQGEVKYYAYKAKNNKFVSGYSLLRAKTKMSINTLKKYVPALIEKGLCHFDLNGDFVLLGNKKVKELYTRKLVPIVIGESFLDTALKVMSVRIHSKEGYQKKEIAKKLTRSEQLKQVVDKSNTNAGKRALKRSVKDESVIIEKTVLSLQGFSKLKDGTLDNKSKGYYWKKKLKVKGLVKTSRRFEEIEKMSFSEYQYLKSVFGLQRAETYNNGFLCRETISSFSAVDLTKVKKQEIKKEIPVSPKKPSKKPIRLDFDMIKFWESGAGN